VTTPAVATHGLTKTYGATRAVVDLDLEVRTGEVFAFLGPNGAGKSTTIRMLLALQQPTAGSAAVLGLDAHADSVEIHRRIGYLPGDLALFPRLTGRHHLDWFSRARGGVDESFVDDLVRRFAVELDRPIRLLSKGNRQKIGIVLAFMFRPDLLILDEPTTGLDPLMQNEFERLLRQTVDEGRTVFLSSHELDEVQRVSDRVAIIKQGRLIVTDTVDGLRRATPRTLEVRFTAAVDPSAFEHCPGVRVITSEPTRVVLELAGDLAPILRELADHDPVDIVSKQADLDELFLSFYRDPQRGAARAH
jgi:ABC-2 type transport system ATP-binding protein